MNVVRDDFDYAGYFYRASVKAGKIEDTRDLGPKVPIKNAKNGVKKVNKKILDLSNTETKVDFEQKKIEILGESGDIIGYITSEVIDVGGFMGEGYKIVLSRNFRNRVYENYLLKLYGKHFGFLDEVYVINKRLLNLMLVNGYRAKSIVDSLSGLEEDILNSLNNVNSLPRLIDEGKFVRLELEE